MKKKAFVFVFVVLLALAVVPATNLILESAQKKEKWWSKPALYNFDFALPFFSRLFYPLGISTNPIQVIIGKNEWLYLGDQYQQTITVKRRKATDGDKESARKIGLATKSWEQWLKSKGVRLYRIMIAPDKGTIYPEFLPDWAQPVVDSSTDTLMAAVSRDLYIDTRPALRSAKFKYPMPLYYKIDTHWNNIGAWEAFRAFISEIRRTETGLRTLSEQQVRISKVNVRRKSDLANFLRMNEMLRDNDVIIEILSEQPIKTEQYDFESGQLTRSGGNPQIDAPQRPLLVKSKHALNQKKILWLRDSFGVALAPLMAATFNETLQIHYNVTNPVLFARMVDNFKPDYVFITVVERQALLKWFENLPPQLPLPGDGKNSIH